MKADIHPTYLDKITVSCSCGAKHEFGSTKDSYKVEVCSKCHPFYTGKKTMLDTAGRVDKFKARMQVAEKRKSQELERFQNRKQSQSLEDVMTAKAAKKEEEKAEKKAKEEIKKKEAAKKAAEKTIVKKEHKEEKSEKKEEKNEE